MVGLTYLTNYLAILLLAVIPAFLLATTDLIAQQFVLIASLIASLFLLWLWGRPRGYRKPDFLVSWRFWVLISTVSSVHPIMVGVRQLLAPHLTIEAGLLIAEASLAGILGFLGQTYYYARYLYGQGSTAFGGVDPIGTGHPITVQLAGAKDEMAILSQAAVPMAGLELTDKVLLLDETDTHYIIGVDDSAMKVSKPIVKVIRYYQSLH